MSQMLLQGYDICSFFSFGMTNWQILKGKRTQKDKDTKTKGQAAIIVLSSKLLGAQSTSSSMKDSAASPCDLCRGKSGSRPRVKIASLI